MNSFVLSSMFFIFTAIQIAAQENIVESKVYKWKDIQVSESAPIGKQLILKGSTKVLRLLEVSAIKLFSSEISAQSSVSDSCETMILAKEGTIEIQIMDDRKTIGPGSMALILPGDTFSIKNGTNKPAVYYLLRFKARTTPLKSRGITSGGSFVIDFNELEFKPHDKGGIRNYYRDRATAMFGFTEMHVTTLNPHIKSHEPHTHSAAEIILMISGKSEMQIGNAFYNGAIGDLYCLESNVSHAISNTGDEPCMYYAIQWE